MFKYESLAGSIVRVYSLLVEAVYISKLDYFLSSEHTKMNCETINTKCCWKCVNKVPSRRRKCSLDSSFINHSQSNIVQSSSVRRERRFSLGDSVMFEALATSSRCSSITSINSYPSNDSILSINLDSPDISLEDIPRHLLRRRSSSLQTAPLLSDVVDNLQDEKEDAAFPFLIEASNFKRDSGNNLPKDIGLFGTTYKQLLYIRSKLSERKDALCEKCLGIDKVTQDHKTRSARVEITHL